MIDLMRLRDFSGFSKPGLAATWRALFCIVLGWMILLLFIWFIQPLIALPYEFPANGSVGNPTTTGTNPYEGVARAGCLASLFFLFGLAVTASIFTDMWGALRERPRISFLLLFLSVYPLVWNRDLSALSSILSGALAFICGLLVVYRERIMQFARLGRNEAEMFVVGAFSGLGLSVLAATIVPDPFYTPGGFLLLIFLGPCLAAIAIAVPFIALRRAPVGNEDTPHWSVVLLAFCFSAASFAQWPGGVAAVVLIPVVIAYIPALVKALGDRPVFGGLVRLPWSCVPVLVVLGATGSLIVDPVDAVHEAEIILPSYLMLLGKMPFRDLHIMHGFGLDCLPNWIAFHLWEPSLFAERMFRGFIAGPLKALLVFLILAELFPRRWAIVAWAFLALNGQFSAPFPYNLFRFEPALFVILLYLRSVGRDSQVYLYLTACAAGVVFFLSPELGVPTSVGVGIALLGGCLLRETRGAYLRALLVMIGTLAAVSAALLSQDLLWGSLDFLKRSLNIAVELVARWPDQDVGNRFILIHIVVVSGSLVALVRSAADTKKMRALIPISFVCAVVTFGMFADHPLRFTQIFALDFLCIAVALMGRWKEHSTPALCCLVLSAMVMAHPWNLGFLLPATANAKTCIRADINERFGPCLLPRSNRALWKAMTQQGKSWGSYFNASNNLIDYFLLDRQLQFPYVPMHLAYRPDEQGQIVEVLRDSAPDHVIFRTQQDIAYWRTTPYTLIFNQIDAEVLKNYRFDRRIGPYHILQRDAGEHARTYNDLIAPELRSRLNFLLAPLHLGKNESAGARKLVHAATSVDPDRRWYWTGVFKGEGKAALRIRSLSQEWKCAPVDIEFSVRSVDGPAPYCVPLWNLCLWNADKPQDRFRFQVFVSKGVTLSSTSLQRFTEKAR